MPTTVTKFFGFGAYVGVIKGLREVGWWPKEPSTVKPPWDAGQLITTDLAKSPLGLVSKYVKSIDDIDVDDHLTNGGLTVIGPRYPQGETVGCIWLSERFYNDLLKAGVTLPRHQTTDGEDYELTSLLYWDKDKDGNDVPGRRFYGFRGKLNTVNGNDYDVDLYHGGRGKVPGEQPKKNKKLHKRDIDLANTTIVNPGDDGAIYIADSQARTLQMMSPKRPEASGGDFY